LIGNATRASTLSEPKPITATHAWISPKITLTEISG
jgi:hypothetical protein